MTARITSAVVFSDKYTSLDPKFVVNCLKKSKSIKLLCFDKVTYYRDKKANNKLFSFYEYEEFHDKFPEAVLELNNAFRFTRYHSQGLRYYFKYYANLAWCIVYVNSSLPRPLINTTCITLSTVSAVMVLTLYLFSNPFENALLCCNFDRITYKAQS